MVVFYLLLGAESMQLDSFFMDIGGGTAFIVWLDFMCMDICGTDNKFVIVMPFTTGSLLA